MTSQAIKQYTIHFTWNFTYQYFLMCPLNFVYAIRFHINQISGPLQINKTNSSMVSHDWL